MTMAGLIIASTAFGQTIIQHLGATDPLSEGFTLTSSGDVQLGPVIGDLGFDSWMIRSRTHTESATYHYSLIPDELQAATTNGWVLSANMRFVEVSEHAWMIMEFRMGTTRFRLVTSPSDGGIVVSGDDIQPFSFEGDALDYHDYALVYERTSEKAALWIDGIEWVTGISGFQTAFPGSAIYFGASGESITNSHWNDVTLAIVPESATLAFLAGLGALLVAGAVRWRHRFIRANA